MTSEKHSEGEETLTDETKVRTCKGICDSVPPFIHRGLLPKNKGA